MARLPATGETPLVWVGASKADYLAFPAEVQDDFGEALSTAQFGGTPAASKPWKGEGPGVFELVERYDGDAYRAVYTVRFKGVVYVLHAFQKKSPSGVRTARTDIEMVSRRLRLARQDFEGRDGDRR